LHFLRSRQYLLRTVGQTVDFARTRGAAFVTVKGGVNAAQHRFQGNARILPGLDQGPVQGGKQESRTAAAAEVLFDLSEIVKVVFHQTSSVDISDEICRRRRRPLCPAPACGRRWPPPWSRCRVL